MLAKPLDKLNRALSELFVEVIRGVFLRVLDLLNEPRIYRFHAAACNDFAALDLRVIFFDKIHYLPALLPAVTNDISSSPAALRSLCGSCSRSCFNSAE